MSFQNLSEEARYFAEEGCAIFALVLASLLLGNKGKFYIYADSSADAARWDEADYEYTHVLLETPKGLLDVKGLRTELSAVAADFRKNPAEMKLLGPFDQATFVERFVGEGDAKPFFGPTEDTVVEAREIIKADTQRYGLTPDLVP